MTEASAKSKPRRRLAVMLDETTLGLVDTEVKWRRMQDGGRHSRASVIRDAVERLVVERRQQNTS